MKKEIGVIMNGVTGRMGANQHLLRSIVAIQNQQGVKLKTGDTLVPIPTLVGRNEAKLKQLSEQANGARYTTNLEQELANPKNEIYFDAQTTDRRFQDVQKAIAAGKHVYCEKPVATTLAHALWLYNQAKTKGVKHGVVQDKLWLPGLLKLQHLINQGFFGKILAVKGEFGYWVFTGEDGSEPQRPSWNYRKEDGGGIISDMLCHWRYVLDNLFGPVQSVSCLGATHIPTRRNEDGNDYVCTADDAAYATFQLENGIIAQFNSSWCTRVRRDDLFTIQVDGTLGSAVAGLRECRIQRNTETPRPVWNPDVPNSINFAEGWQETQAQEVSENAFKKQWELFLRHVAEDVPFPWGLREGAKGVQLAELGIESWKTRTWVDIPELPK